MQDHGNFSDLRLEAAATAEVGVHGARQGVCRARHHFAQALEIAIALGKVWNPGALRIAQANAERRAYRTRMQTLRQDRELNRLIGFSGPVT